MIFGFKELGDWNKADVTLPFPSPQFFFLGEETETMKSIQWGSGRIGLIQEMVLLITWYFILYYKLFRNVKC